jgi:hypothetical protein
MEKVATAKANVVLWLWLAELRGHPLGPKFAEILSCIPQWKDFLGSVDPMEFDTVMVSGPQLVDSSKAIIIVQRRDLSTDRARELIGGLVKRSGGRGAFLEDAPAGQIAARFHADRADRIVVTHPRDLVFIIPPEVYEQVKAAKGPVPMRPSKGHVLELTLLKPWRPARRIGFALSESISELHLTITPNQQGDTIVEADLDDTEADAPGDAEAIRAQLAAYSLFVHGTATPAGSKVNVRVELSRTWSAFLLGMIEAQACPDRDGGAILPAGRPPTGLP